MLPRDQASSAELQYREGVFWKVLGRSSHHGLVGRSADSVPFSSSWALTCM